MCEIAIGPHLGGHDGPLPLLCTAQDGCAGSIAKQHTRRAILPIGDRGKFFRPDDQGVLERTVGDETLADFQRVNETRAGRRDIECHRLEGSDLLLHMTGRGRRGSVRSNGGHHDEFDFLRPHAGLLKRLEGSLAGHVRGELVVRGNTPLADPGACDDPLVSRIDHRGQIIVGENFLRHITASARHTDFDQRRRFAHAAGD